MKDHETPNPESPLERLAQDLVDDLGLDLGPERKPIDLARECAKTLRREFGNIRLRDEKGNDISDKARDDFQLVRNHTELFTRLFAEIDEDNQSDKGGVHDNCRA